jgi:hypothetical protein
MIIGISPRNAGKRYLVAQINAMPTLDPQTAIRPANDIDLAEEVAWSIIEQRRWVATPQLLFALKALAAEELAGKQ